MCSLAKCRERFFSSKFLSLQNCHHNIERNVIVKIESLKNMKDWILNWPKSYNISINWLCTTYTILRLIEIFVENRCNIIEKHSTFVQWFYHALMFPFITSWHRPTIISFLDETNLFNAIMEVNISTNIDSLEHFIPVNTFSMTIL